MKKKKTKVKYGLGFLVLLLLLFIGLDLWLSAVKPVSHSELFLPNDFEKTLYAHNWQTEYDDIFFGNSVVISAYIEEESPSGYANFGIDYGKADDLNRMLRSGAVKVSDNVVLGLNCFTLMDTLDTNPAYPWNRKLYEPYVFFERDRLNTFITDTVNGFLETGRFEPALYTSMDKTVYYDVLSDAELAEKDKTYKELYYGQGMDAYDENLKALQELCQFCEAQGIRLRVIWMPWNDYVPLAENPSAAMAAAAEIHEAHGIECLDMRSALPRDCFYDFGHLNIEHGAHVFTQEVDEWLNT